MRTGRQQRARALFGVALGVAMWLAVAGPARAQPQPPASAPVAAALPSSYVCTGNEPSWKLEIGEATGNFSQLSGSGADERQLKGRLASAAWANVPFVVWRGRTDAGLRELVAVITAEACKDTMSEEGPGRGEFPFTARLSTPQGEVRTGCCRPGAADAAWTPPTRPAPPVDRITGTVSYRARIALTPEAVLRVGLYDTARADAEAVAISEVSMTRPGQVPIAFELPYPTARINPKRAYTVRAAIFEGDRLVMTTTRAYRVITDGQPTRVELMLDLARTPGQ